MENSHNTQGSTSLTHYLPQALMRAVAQVEKHHFPFYITGGTLRDRLLGRNPADFDITVKEGALQCCRDLLDVLHGGALVKLGTDTEEAARVVWQGNCIDFSAFRKGAQTIEEELHHRDFSINALAVELRHSHEPCAHLIDPLGGLRDLREGILRCCPGAFADDPLRMLRGYRLRAELGFTMDNECITMVKQHCKEIRKSALERVHYELDRIMTTASAAEVFGDMAGTGLLWEILPELKEGVGLEQPGYHHEDVFHHSILALQCLDRVMAEPNRYFAEHTETVTDYLDDDVHRRRLRWSALFHDLGKPSTFSSGTMGGRITFYNHDRVGREIFTDIARRLRMSRVEAERIGMLIEMHMHPFHLSNVRRKGQLSRRALLRICKKAGNELPGLFVLAMADSLAGQGELKPADMEQELSSLFDEIKTADEKLVQPALHGEKLVTGNDLIGIFHLSPGPYFREIFDELEVARVEEKVRTREDALSWVGNYIGNDN